MKKVLFPGSFDPITNAHLDIVKRVIKMGFAVEICIFINSSKSDFFSKEERLQMILNVIANQNLSNVSASIEHKLLIDVCREKKIKLIARGIRSIKDYEYEKEMEYNNKQLMSEIEYIYLNANVQNNYVSSTIVRELIRYQTSVKHLVPAEVIQILEQRNNNE